MLMLGLFRVMKRIAVIIVAKFSSMTKRKVIEDHVERLIFPACARKRCTMIDDTT